MRLSSELGIRVQQSRLDMLAHNAANINTPGFKASVVSFAEAFDEQEYQATKALYGGIPSGQSLGVGRGTLYYGKRLDLAQGSVMDTENPWDLSIVGQGFFQVMTDDGRTAYTRDGAFQLDKKGRLVNGQGKPFIPNIVIPEGATEINVRPNGEIVYKDVTGQVQVKGPIVIANFKNPHGLQQVGDNLFLESQPSGPPIVGKPGTNDLGEIRSYSLEKSNVDLASLMTTIVQVQRAYQIGTRLLKQSDEMWAQANMLRR